MTLPTTQLFVYGSLKRGFTNPYALQLQHEARYLCTGKFRGLLLSLGPYPAVVPQATGDHYVYGEVYELGPQVDTLLASLDDYEDYDAQFPEAGEYRREIRGIETASGTLACWVYTYNRPWHERVVVRSGIWPI